MKRLLFVAVTLAAACQHAPTAPQAISDYSAAIRQAANARYTDESRTNLNAVFERTRDWLAQNVGPVQRESFVNA